MVQYRETIWCDGCGVEILWTPLIEKGLQYCCLDCQQGFGCDCGEILEEEYREKGSQSQTSTPQLH